MKQTITWKHLNVVIVHHYSLMWTPIDQDLVLQTTSGELRDTSSCPLLNISVLARAEYQSLSASLSFFHCRMLNVTKLKLTPGQMSDLKRITQRLHSMIDMQYQTDCSIPHFEQAMCKYAFVKDLLQHLDNFLSGCCPN